jgi:prephenate dehydratase
MKLAFLGPAGTYTEEALAKRFDPAAHELVACQTVSDVFAAVESGEADKGIVPIENSIEGAVTETLDHLAFEAEAVIEQEVLLEIHHHLVGLPGAIVRDIQTVISHPQASAQCRRFLRNTFGSGITILPAFSTADAAARVAEAKDPSVAAIANRLAASLYGLDILIKDISDYEDNTTRFVIIGKSVPQRTGYDKTSIVCFIAEDRPGSLLEILQEFSYRSINLTKIASRPTKKKFGDYCFFIDFEGHIEDPIVQSALKCLACKLPRVKILGSYPRSL